MHRAALNLCGGWWPLEPGSRCHCAGVMKQLLTSTRTTCQCDGPCRGQLGTAAFHNRAPRGTIVALGPQPSLGLFGPAVSRSPKPTGIGMQLAHGGVF